MSDINRVYAHIEAYLCGGGFSDPQPLTKTLFEFARATERYYHDSDEKDENRKERIVAARLAVEDLRTNPPPTEQDAQTKFRDVTERVMIARREILSLDTEIPWKKLDPKEALYDNDDQYSFAVYDTLADEIAELLPDLHQLASEATWEGGDDSATV